MPKTQQRNSVISANQDWMDAPEIMPQPYSWEDKTFVIDLKELSKIFMVPIEILENGFKEDCKHGNGIIKINLEKFFNGK